MEVPRQVHPYPISSNHTIFNSDKTNPPRMAEQYKSFPRYFRCLMASPGRAVESWSWRGTSMVRGLIAERSYPWAVKPAGLNGSIRHRLSAQGIRGFVAARVEPERSVAGVDVHLTALPQN